MKNLKQIRNVLTNNYHGMKLTDKDLYVKGDYLFVENDNEIYQYSYPMNDYFEATNSWINFTDLSLKNWVEFHVVSQKNSGGIMQ